MKFWMRLRTNHQAIKRKASAAITEIQFIVWGLDFYDFFGTYPA
jgi:hypothetical protein